MTAWPSLTLPIRGFGHACEKPFCGGSVAVLPANVLMSTCMMERYVGVVLVT